MNNTDKNITIIGSGAAGLFCALCFPYNYNITIITKETVEDSDSYLAQGGICVLRDPKDYHSYFEDTMKAGHYENRAESVEIMILSSNAIIQDLISYGVSFHKENGHLAYTKEGAHSKPRILYHEDITGKEITSKLYEQVKQRPNIKVLEHTTMLDIITDNHNTTTDSDTSSNEYCTGIIVSDEHDHVHSIYSDYTVMACGGLGGLYQHSTNFHHISGDALGIALKHHIELENINYIQIHPTTLYSSKPGRRFLISESVRGEGAILLDKNKERFVNELLPRDLLTIEVRKQMKKDNTPFVWLSMAPIPEETIKKHFPNIYKHCLEEGYDCTKECIPVVPAQHYFMGGIHVNKDSATSMQHLYAVGETSCNGVHGKNRLASNSLLESLVFAKRCAHDIDNFFQPTPKRKRDAGKEAIYETLTKDVILDEYHTAVKHEIERIQEQYEQNKLITKC